ncbi:TonB-dependent siderophore receptor [Comamonas thiooxydans]|uniref:TonB-dependent siderophore receptor n=1 Tax=Comamonas thiooxydans TaxID=363952 RepID=UPI000B351BF3|nr:TonB-dependent siderophore receptor [Comamonas thiooxydans]BDR10922.1 TonB-dependent siderophore receptor [Comamonas thiooxydans]
MQAHPPVSLTILAAASLIAMATSAVAQESTVTSTLPAVTVTGAPDDYRPPATSTATRTDTPSLQTSQSVQVVPRAVIEDQNALTLTDAVRNVSGVQYDFGFNGSMQPLLILRGFPSTSMTAMGSMSGSSSYYLDGSKVMGVPINMANVQSVEVVKGPASVLYGRSEPGGLVNVVTKPISSVSELSFEQTIGQRGLSRTAIEASGSLNADQTLRGRVAASHYTADSIRDFVEDRLSSFTGSLAWVPDARTNVTATLDYSDNRYRTDYGIPAVGNRPADLPWSRQYNDSPYLSSAKTTSLKLDASHQLNDAWQIKGRLLSLRSDTSEMDIAPYRVDMGMAMLPSQTCPGTGDPMCRYYFGVRPDGRYKVDQVNVDLTGKFQTGGIGHTVLVGFDTYRTKKTGTTYTQQVDAVSVYNPSLGNTPGLDPMMSMPQDYDDHSRWTSFYVQDQLALGNGVFLTGALRHDRTNAVFGMPGTEPNKQSFTTPRLGAVWQFAPNQSIYAQYQDSVAANNGRDAVTGAALDSERARQIEIGHKIELFDGKLSSTVALFELTKRNRGATVPDPLSPTLTNVVTIGKAVARGLEWDVSGQLTKKLSLIGSYAYTDAKVTEDPTYQGMKLANVARHTASLWARYAVDSQWTVGGGVFAQSQRQGDSGNTFQLPGYARVDAMVAYRFALGASKASLQFNLDNVFNRKYYTGSHQFLQDWIKLGNPRTAKLTLRVDY